MPDDRDRDDQQFDWLYSGKGKQPPPPPEDDDATQVIDRRPAAQTPVPPSTPAASPPPPGPPEDPDATQLMARPDRRPSTPPPAPTDDSDHTRIIEAQPRPPAPGASAAGAGAGAAAAGAGAAAAGASAAPASFGGTYPAPVGTRPATSASSPRFATPSTAPLRPTPPSQPPQGPGGAGAQPAPPRKKRRRWWLRVILLLLALWLVFLVVVPIWAWQKISKVDADPGGDRPADTGGTTYLLVGSDSRADLSKEQRADLGTGAAEGQRTDTIILLHVPDGGGPRLLLSIPRDSYVDIPGHGENKINAAYSFGGPQLLVQTVEQASQVRIDDYIEIGFAGFVDIVDAIGGIQVCPKTSINDPKAGHLVMRKGCQDVDGHTALGYSRSRAFPLGDITRAEHQREVITQMGKQAASWKTVVLPWRYFEVNKAAAETLQVGENVGPFDLARFAWAMAHTGGSDTKRCVVPYSDLGASTSAGSAVLWDEAKAEALFEWIRDDDTSAIRCKAK